MVKKIDKPDTAAPRSDHPEKEFLGAALNMSWQLAIVVLVPVIGGFELDKKLGSLPGFTAVGFVIAMIGMAVVVWRQVQLLTPDSTKPSGGHRS